MLGAYLLILCFYPVTPFTFHVFPASSDSNMIPSFSDASVVTIIVYTLASFLAYSYNHNLQAHIQNLLPNQVIYPLYQKEVELY